MLRAGEAKTELSKLTVQLKIVHQPKVAKHELKHPSSKTLAEVQRKKC